MKRLRRRTIIALVLAGALAAGVLFFCFQLIGKGNDWVGFFGTRYYDSGAIYDRNGVLLYDGQTKSYAENQATRVSTLHLVGDQNFGTSLRSVLASRLTGYNLVTGTSLGSHDVTLTIDAALNETAYAALNGRKGVVAVYDYTTGDLLCEVSSPSYDPNNPPSDINENPAYEGVYLNRFFSSTYPPGSVFKLVTTAAAIEQKKDLDQFRYTCTGSLEVDGDVITCPYAHGENMDIKQCLATSCNGAYATLAMELGGKTLGEYLTDAVMYSKKPIIMSHVGAKGVWDIKRMAGDDLIKAIGAKGGVVGIESAPHTTMSKTKMTHDLDSVMEHFEYVKNLIGIDHVGFGVDCLYGDHVGVHHAFAAALSTAETANTSYEEVPFVWGLENPTEASWNIIRWLVKHNYSEEDIGKVIGGNAIRVLREVWA